LGIVENLLF